MGPFLFAACCKRALVLPSRTRAATLHRGTEMLRILFTLLGVAISGAAIAAGAAGYTPVAALPHPGELFFSADEARASSAAATSYCHAPFIAESPPYESPDASNGPDPDQPLGTYIASDMMAASSYLLRLGPGEGAPAIHIKQAVQRLIDWAKADSMRGLSTAQNAPEAFRALPAFLVADNAFEQANLLSKADAAIIRKWLGKMADRARIGHELDRSGPYQPGDPRTDFTNNRRNLFAMLWAIETNDVALFNYSVENGFVRFLKTMGDDGHVPDNYHGAWGLWDEAYSLGALVFMAEAARHQGVDLYALEIDGHSLDKAIAFFLDANDDPSLIGQYANKNVGMEFAALGLKSYEGFEDVKWKTRTVFGISHVAWTELYVRRFPDSPNTPRLMKLLDQVWKNARHFELMDWSFGNVSCFWGDDARAATVPPMPKAVETDVAVLADQTTVAVHTTALGIDKNTPAQLTELGFVSKIDSAKKGQDIVRFRLSGLYAAAVGNFLNLRFHIDVPLSDKIVAKLDACGGHPPTVRYLDGKTRASITLTKVGNDFVVPDISCLVTNLPPDLAFMATFLTTQFQQIAAGMVVDGTVDAVPHNGVRDWIKAVAAKQIVVRTE